MEFCPGGELFYFLHRVGKLTESQAKFYFVEILLAIEYLHNNQIMYRDLKVNPLSARKRAYYTWWAH